jgi:hypothetical protein
MDRPAAPAYLERGRNDGESRWKRPNSLKSPTRGCGCCTDLWQIYRDDAPAPRRADLDVFDSPLWLGHLSLLEAIENGVDFRYLIYGRALAAYYGRDLNGKTTRDLSAVVGNLVRREYRQAYIAQRPVLVERRRRVRGVSIMIAK